MPGECTWAVPTIITADITPTIIGAAITLLEPYTVAADSMLAVLAIIVAPS